MVKVFLDTNVLLDVLQQREEFLIDSANVLSRCLSGVHEGRFSALSVCDIMYIMCRRFPQDKVLSELRKLSASLEMLDVKSTEVKAALISGGKDFEDSVQRICAEDNGSDVIVTRDKGGFANARIPVLTPAEFLAMSS